MRLRGVIERIIYKNTDNGYTVLSLEAAEGGTVTAVGTMPLVAEGEQIEVEGDYATHPTHGQQFTVTAFTSRLPATETAILRYLSSGIVRGVREKSARQLVDAFGPDTLEVLENEPERVAQLHGFSRQRADGISESIRSMLGVKSILLYFQQFGVTPASAFKIYRQWGVRAYDVLRQNPYRLCEIRGIGFETADRIAAAMGYDRQSENRFEAGIIYVISQNLYGNGHTFLPKQKLAAVAAEMLETTVETVTRCLDSLIATEVLAYVEKIGNADGVYLREIYDCERAVAARILADAPVEAAYPGDFDGDVERIQRDLGIRFAERQRAAILEACRRRVMILTGGPGTGKTTTLTGIIRAFEQLDVSFALAAPTGRAAKRIAELTRHNAKTLHRLLEYQPQQDEYVFTRNRENPLKYDAVIVDEASMVDLTLLAALLEALPDGAKLILVGDAAQLPPVGPGRVLKDLIDSGAVATVELTEIFRQARESLIVTNAHAILGGRMPDLSTRNKDFFFLPQHDPQRLVELVTELCATRLPDAYGYDPLTDIQVLSPTRKGRSGTVTLNAALRDGLNPKDPLKRELMFRGVTFREGDKVMQTRNNYDLETLGPSGEPDCGVFNGDIGIIERIDVREEQVTVRFDDRSAQYSVETLEDLEPAYAITVHKSQGSEFDAVILPLLEGSDLLFTRNLLYTAVTRARQLLIITGASARVEQMVRSVRGSKRYSGLKYRLTAER